MEKVKEEEKTQEVTGVNSIYQTLLEFFETGKPKAEQEKKQIIILGKQIKIPRVKMRQITGALDIVAARDWVNLDEGDMVDMLKLCVIHLSALTTEQFEDLDFEDVEAYLLQFKAKNPFFFVFLGRTRLPKIVQQVGAIIGKVLNNTLSRLEEEEEESNSIGDTEESETLKLSEKQ